MHYFLPSSPPAITPHTLKQFGFSLLAWLTVLVSVDVAEASSSPRYHPQAGQVLLKNNGDFEPALHMNSEANITINGLLAKVQLIQHFKNNSDEWREGIYVFPLAESAAVNYMHLKVGERVIVSEVKERGEAKRIYQQAKSQGKKAALTEQERPNLFTQSIANIAPHESVSVEIHYLQKVDYRDGAFNLHFPMTLTPRYNPGLALVPNGDESLSFSQTGNGWGTATHSVPDGARITPPQDSSAINPIAINVTIDAGLPLDTITSLSHPLKMQSSGQRYHVGPDSQQVAMDRDFLLQWTPKPSATPQAALFSETIEGQHYAMAMLLPPTTETPIQPLPRELIFVVDTSGSMQGDSIEQARESLLMALGRLQPYDRFNVIEFDSHYSTLFPVPAVANEKNLQRARQFVRSLTADNGTEMAPALAEALRHPAADGYLKQVVFITDGAVGNEAYLFEMINTRLQNARLFTVGIGSAPNRFFMRKAAQFGRGTYVAINDIGHVNSHMSALFEKLESAVMSNLQIEWPSASEVYPQRLPDLYHGEPLMLTAKLGQTDDTLTLQGYTGGTQWQRQIRDDGKAQHEGIATLWARDKIDTLLDEKIAGRDAGEVRQAVLDVALRHQLVSPYTSLVAVEQVQSRPDESLLKTSAVPNAKPKNNATLNYPQTATFGPLQQLLGGIGLLALILVRQRKAILKACHS